MAAMTPEEFAARMREIAKDAAGDREAAHSHADNLMCEALKALGYGEGVEVFVRMERWYA